MFKNCLFFSNAAAAEAAGFRPCLRCRPELAPGHASFDSPQRIAHAAARLIESGELLDSNLESLAQKLQVTSRHLRRIFQGEFGATPVEFAQTQRLLLAKRLLTDTALPMTQVAFASGFGSVRRFHATFHERYRLSPSKIRKSSKRAPDVLTFDLGYRPPYDWIAMSSFLAARSIAGVEAVTGNSYHRILQLSCAGRTHTGWLEMAPSPRADSIRVILSSTLIGAIPAVLAKVKHVLDLACNPAQIGSDLGSLAAAKPGLRVPGAFDGFEIAVRAILGQQVSVAAARTLAGRLAATFGTPLSTPFPELTTTFPQAALIANLSTEDLSKLGILPSRANTLIALATQLASGSFTLTPGVDVPATIEKLQSIPGIGQWTAQYIAMRALAWPDAFPHTDLGVMKALGVRNPRSVLEAGEAWRPWRAYAVMHLWAGGLSHAALRG